MRRRWIALFGIGAVLLLTAQSCGGTACRRGFDQFASTSLSVYGQGVSGCSVRSAPQFGFSGTTSLLPSQQGGSGAFTTVTVGCFRQTPIFAGDTLIQFDSGATCWGGRSGVGLQGATLGNIPGLPAFL
jgi:hypothetical protein